MRQFKGDGREHGFTLCTTNGELVKGPEAVGHRTGVKIDIKCPRGAKPIGSYHTHPGGTVTPSDADVREMQRFRLRHLCIGVPETKQVVCHRVRRRR